MRQAVVLGVVLLAVLALAAQPGAQKQPAKTTSPSKARAANATSRDLAKFTIQQRLFYLSGQRAMDWLERANKPDGRFIAGFVPDLRVPMEGDSYIRQAGAALALAQAARFYKDERSAAIAKQALLTLLLETSVDPKNPCVRNVPIHQANPLMSAGLILAAIHELPSPAADLLDQGDQLANLLHAQIQADGSLNVARVGDEAAAGPVAESRHAEAMQHLTGPALYGIAVSQRRRPAAWKLEALRKACDYYFTYWKQNKNLPMAVWHSEAYTEAYLLTKESCFAAAVFEMNDWLCGLQYQQVDPARASWLGGFQPWIDGKAAASAPDIGSAGAVLSVAAACRLARATGDVQHYRRYRQALESGLLFLTTLQYSEANTQHFADWYRPALIGAFHASAQDGNLRLDYNQNALAALVQYLEHVAELP